MKFIYTLIFFLFGLVTKASDLSALYEKVNGAVVVILTEEKQNISRGFENRTVTQDGLGSGFMISDQLVVTASHVVKVAENIKVEFEDGEVIPAKVRSSIDRADIAMLELMWPKKNAVTVQWGNSDSVKVGEQICIIGAPYGLDHSLSSGYVSGFLKKTEGENVFNKAEFIQTDAAINTGNSGGPMFNLKGEVIGVVSYILSESGGFNGIGFGVTSNLAKELLIEKKYFWSGMDAIPIHGELAKIFNLPQPVGLLVQRVVLLSPFGLIGLEGGKYKMAIGDTEMLVGGDIILEFEGVQIGIDPDSLNKLEAKIQNMEKGTRVKLKVLRGGKIIELK